MRVVTLKHRLIAIPLMALVLGASAAPVLSRMTCLTGGHHTLAIGNIEDCCPEDVPVDQPVVKATCCDFAQAVPAKEDYRPEPPLALAVGTGATIDGPLTSMALLGDVPSTDITSRPPPLTAPLRLSRISLFQL